MTLLLCETCGKRLPPPKANIWTGTEFFEHERVKWGVAKKQDSRVEAEKVVINGQEFDLPKTFSCDGCLRAIGAGETCCCYSRWTDPQPEPEAWEPKYLEAAA